MIIIVFNVDGRLGDFSLRNLFEESDTWNILKSIQLVVLKHLKVIHISILGRNNIKK